MSIDTRIEGDPDSVRATAGWLRDEFAVMIDATADTMYSSRNNMDSAWDGPTSELACTKMTGAAQRVVDMAAAARTCAAAIDEFAAALRSAQDRMATVRSDAIAGDLTVAGEVILRPTSPTPGQRAAYEAALHAAEAVDQLVVLAGETVKNSWIDLQKTWFFDMLDLVSAAAEVLAAKRISHLRTLAAGLFEESARLLELARSAPPGTPASLIYRDVDWSRDIAARARSVSSAADDFESRAGKFFVGLGGALTVAAIAYDIHGGKPVDQAIVSGGMSFGASILAGAALGTLIPVPVAGTVVGAAGGILVGIFTSGAVDTLYSEGLGSVGEAISDGASAVADTGIAIGELATGVFDALF